MILSSTYFIIIIYFYFLSLCNSIYVPKARHRTSSVLVKDRLYFIGGFDSNLDCLDDVFYLNLSKSFNATEPPFENVSTNLEEKICWTSSSLAEGGKKIYIFGEKSSSLIYSFDFNTQQWNVPEIEGTAPERRKQFQMVSDNKKETLYIFGGLTNNGTGWFNDMNILDTINSSWQNIMILGAEQIIIPPYWTDFTATMLLTGEIVYIGGRQSTSPSGQDITFTKMDKIYVFDTKSSSWNIINADGDVPDSRIGHSAVLASDNRIIVYGGSSNEDLTTPSMPDLVILIVDSTPYQWKTPNVNVKTESPSSRSFHSAEITQDYMIVGFGNTFDSGSTNSLNILDISDDTNFYWTSSYKSVTKSEYVEEINKIPHNGTSTEVDGPLFTQNFSLILGSVIGGILSFVIISVVTILLYKKYWKARKERSLSQHLQLPSNSNSS